MGCSSCDNETERRMGTSVGARRSIGMTGVSSFDSDTFRSLSFAIDFRTDPKAEKGPLDGPGEAVAEDVAFLLGPKGSKERSVRKVGIPELAGVVGVLFVDGPGE